MYFVMEWLTYKLTNFIYPGITHPGIHFAWLYNQALRVLGCVLAVTPVRFRVTLEIYWRLSHVLYLPNVVLRHLSVPEQQFIQVQAWSVCIPWGIKQFSDLHDTGWSACRFICLVCVAAPVGTIMIDCDSLTIVRTSVDHGHVNPSVGGKRCFVKEITVAYSAIVSEI